VIAATGLSLLIAGLFLDPVFVINKRIWTSSFALLSSGFSALLLAALILLLRSDVLRRLAAPFRVLGANAILAFVISTLLGRLYGWTLLANDESPQHWLNTMALGMVSDPYLASLLCALLMLALVTMILWPLHRRALYFRL
jgi:predicted acyltransferase